MTVLNTTNFIRVNGDGADTTFEFSFPVKTENDVVVKKILNSTGVATTLTITTDYTVALNTVTEGGTITYVVAPTALQDSFIKRALTQDQQTALPIGGNFPEVSVENEIDRSRMIDIEIQEQIGRCIIISETETLTEINAPMGTSASNRATKVWAWNDDGDGLVLGTGIGSFTGDWATSRAYSIRDLIKDTSNNNIYYCNEAHTSSGAEPISTNADVAKWDLIVDSASATASAAAAATSETNAATSETNAAASETAAATSETNAETAETNAEAAQAAAEVAQAAAEAAAQTTPLNFSTTADPTANSDSVDTDGNGLFVVGSRWVNTTTNEPFTCVDSTATAAIWHGTQGTEGATIADGGTPDIFNNGDGDTVHLAGTTTITDFPDAPRVGMWRKIIFDGIRTFTHGSGITLPGSANITTAVGDYAFVYADAVDAFTVLYFRADGKSVTGITLGTEQASTSGTAIDFTGIPAGTKRITINFVGVSTDGTNDLIVQIGDSGGVETSGYLGATWTGNITNQANTDGFGVTASLGATSVIHGQMILALENSSAFTWTAMSITSRDAGTTNIGSGSKSLSAELNTLRITTTGTPDDFDLGKINIQFE